MDKLNLQSTCFENIKSLCTNYKKDSMSRKNVEYLTKRLNSLENQWLDFEERHKILTNEIEDKNINYFKDGVYMKTKAMYEVTKTDISELMHFLQASTSAKFDLSGITGEQADDKLKTLLNKQECNFKALDRAMSKINLKTISEKWELEDHLAILKAKWEAIDKQHWELEGILKGSNDNYYSMFVNIEDKYDEMRKNLNSKIWSTVHYQQSTPKIQLPDFSGDYSQWVSFKDLFLETIHNNPMINNAQKMQHLKTKLKGEAERLVQHLNISADNYTSCWEILNQRYDNRRLQFTSFVNTMLQLPTIQQPDANNLKKLHDVISECLNGLSNIGVETANWDPLIVHLMSQKLDTTTFNEYMREVQDHKELPMLNEFLFFLENKFLAYETMRNSKKEISISERQQISKPFNKPYTPRKVNYDFRKYNSKTYHTVYGQCPLCSGNHVLMQCPSFIDMDTAQRNNKVAKLRLCKNCLFSHGDKECTSAKTCKECNLKHHTLLHYVGKKTGTTTNYEKSISSQQPSTSSQSSNHLSSSETQVLLTTVQLKIKTISGTYVTLRGLLDQGSQVNLITENAAQLLNLPRNKLNATISGIGSVSGDCEGRLELTCKAIHSDYTFKTQALIMKKLTNNLPDSSFEKENWPHLEGLKLADPEYNVSRSVDLLLGADVYSDIILDGIFKGKQQHPIAQRTKLGWILCGKLKTFNCHVTLVDLKELSKYWETEDIIQGHKDMPVNEQCEEFYKNDVQRNLDDKYVVKMPLCADYDEKLGNSRAIAVSLQQEKRLERSKKLASMYQNFMKEYIDLEHMKLSTKISTTQVYLPHHGVLREQSTTTKLRVVFNDSQKTASSSSFNIVLEKGPNLKQKATLQLTKRILLADISKLYDPLVSIKAKLLSQNVWKSELAYNDSLPTDIQNEWTKIKTELPNVKNLQLNRWIGNLRKNIVLFGFIDCSEKAFSSVVYSRVASQDRQPIITLLAAKTRVAPLSQKTTLPRFELCGALLLSQLIEKRLEALTEHRATVRVWCDFQVVLAWLQGETTKWEKYAANRVARIKPEVIRTLEHQETLPSPACLFTTNLEQANVTTLTPKQNFNNFINGLLNKHSSLNRIISITACTWIQRCVANMRSKAKSNTAYHTASELIQANELITKCVQVNDFGTQHTELIKNTMVSKKSNIYKLNPYLDEKDGLNNSNLSAEEKNPIILSREGRMTKPIIQQAHAVTLNNVARLTFRWFATFLFLFTLITGAHSYSARSGANITSFERERPMYYDTMGKVQLIHDKWTLLMYYNLTNYWDGVQHIQNYLETVQDLCQRTDPRYCQTTLEQLRHEMDILNYYNMILLSPHKHLSKRKKRGLINGVGYIANSLFGILDQEFAEKYQRDIQTVQQNEDYLLELIKNQTTIVELENHLLKKNEENIKQQLTRINDFIKQTNVNLAKIESELEVVMATNYFNSVSLATYLLLTNLKKVQEMLFNTLTDVYKGHVDVHLVTPVTLIKQLSEISGKLPRTLSLPVERIREDIKDLYKLMYVKARVTETYFLFEIHIPLISDEDFTLYRAIPLPIQTDAGIGILKTSSKYVAMNFLKNTYIPLTEEDIKLCMQRSTDNLICSTTVPVFNLDNKNTPCEAKLLSHHSTLPCDMKSTTCKDAWIKLRAANTWLTICCGSCKLRSVCENDVTTYTMSSSGIVTLAQGCILQSKDFTIYSHNRYNSQTNIDSDYKIPTLNSSVNRIVNITYNNASWFVPSEDKELMEIDKRLKHQKESEQKLPSTISHHDIHQYVVTYAIVATILTISAVWLIRKCRLRRRSNKSTTGAAPKLEEIEMQEIRRPQATIRRTHTQIERPQTETTAADNIAFSFD